MRNHQADSDHYFGSTGHCNDQLVGRVTRLSSFTTCQISRGTCRCRFSFTACFTAFTPRFRIRLLSARHYHLHFRLRFDSRRLRFRQTARRSFRRRLPHRLPRLVLILAVPDVARRRTPRIGVGVVDALRISEESYVLRLRLHHLAVQTCDNLRRQLVTEITLVPPVVLPIGTTEINHALSHVHLVIDLRRLGYRLPVHARLRISAGQLLGHLIQE